LWAIFKLFSNKLWKWYASLHQLSGCDHWRAIKHIQNENSLWINSISSRTFSLCARRRKENSNTAAKTKNRARQSVKHFFCLFCLNCSRFALVLIPNSPVQFRLLLHTLVEKLTGAWFCSIFEASCFLFFSVVNCYHKRIHQFFFRFLRDRLSLSYTNSSSLFFFRMCEVYC
jgi:hypothetical protein